MKASAMLQIPIPAFVAAVQPYPDGIEQLAQGMATTVLIAIWVLAWVLDKMGKLPGSKPTNEVGLTPDQAAQLTRLVEVVTREDKDKPGWPMVWSSAEESRAIRGALKQIADGQRIQNQLLEEAIQRGALRAPEGTP